MSNHYDTPESIFSIPADVDAIERRDLIEHTIGRIKGTVMTVNAAIQNSNDAELGIPDNAIPECLWSIYGQLEQLEKLIKFEVKEDKS